MPVTASLTLAGLLFVAPLVPSSSPAAAPPQQQQPQTNAQQATPARDVRAPAGSTSGIRGRVVAADTGAPLRRAAVTLSGGGMRESRVVATDMEGRFEFKRVPAGRFTLSAGKVGYVTLRYGQRRAFQQGRPIEITSGQSVDNVSFALPRGAVIAGTVTNDLGEPAQGTYVMAARVRFDNGRRDLMPAGRTAQTDDLGQFRICNLPPGSYYVGTSNALPGAQVTEEGLALAPTYYPGTTNAAEGRLVTVRVGQEVRGINVPLVAGRSSSVSGTVRDSRGRPASSALVSVKPSEVSVMSTLNATNAIPQSDGKFTFANLLPGDYLLHASARNGDTGEEESADMPLRVGGVGIEELSIITAPNARINGSIALEGDTKPQFSPASLRVSVVSPLRISSTPSIGTVDTNWNFQIRNVEPGRRTIVVDPIPSGWALKKIVVNDVDATESAVDVPPASTAQMVITLTDKPTAIAGSVTSDVANKQANDYTVVLFGDSPDQWNEGSRRVVVARPDQNGAYKIVGSLPGKYRIIALEYLDDGEQWNPELLGWARSRGRLVEINEGDSVQISLKITRYGE